MVGKGGRPRFASSSRRGDIAFTIGNYSLISFFVFICVFPFLNQFATAFSGEYAIQTGQVFIWPVDFQLDAMKAVLIDNIIFRSLLVTVFLAVAGTLLNLLFTVITAYPLSRRDLKGRVPVINFILITMLFSGGMIPSFLLVKELGMLDTLWALIVPGLVNAFYVFIMMSFFRSLPEEIRESATVDGCGNIRFIMLFVLPLSKAALATIGLFYAVSHWNSYFSAVLYIDNPDLYPLQVKLRNILLLSQMDTSMETLQEEFGLELIQESLKAATIVYSTVPILFIYPWLQKYFVKGVMIGSVKG
ncbi:carbohydrate ABC transporter permease [Paenibacillus sp. J5C_2022]|uniref:carbohydrate ABC transporter permease n=1 Tax=Paenibacillus sp. J5C2022 TaxID=2977129 RepID=UPI0021D03918|nr:carbohydrate ABC transporter permease [Paenibacillus sp. J5C2022]MCU6707843.1 carbohydrate ABC transporter permease [Paenibacillus sp. J5C2022]